LETKYFSPQRHQCAEINLDVNIYELMRLELVWKYK